MIRKAKRGEHPLLTKISFASKNYWNYPEEYLAAWRDELTISSQYMSQNRVYVHETHKKISGYYSLVELHEPLQVGEILLHRGFWLDHMFVHPQHIGQGIGTQLFHHCTTISRGLGHGLLRILADPNSSTFYRKMGCIYICEYPSTIAGRTTPYYEFPLT